MENILRTIEASLTHQQHGGQQHGVLKRNYNLDHLARMNFRRSFRAPTHLNTRHILGSL